MTDELSALPSPFSPSELVDIPAALSEARFGTYLAAAGNDRAQALRLYVWNAKVSAAFGPPLHLAEVAVRNAVAGAIGRAYKSSGWHESQTLSFDLKDPAKGYSPRKDLMEARAEARRQIEAATEHRNTAASKRARIAGLPPPTPQAIPDVVPVGKVIAELRFAFWVSMLTSGHQTSIWDEQLGSAFPHLPGSEGSDKEVVNARLLLHDELNMIRKFRNRVAHHEPILRAPVADELRRIFRVVGWSCPVTAAWMERSQDVDRLLSERP